MRGHASLPQPHALDSPVYRVWAPAAQTVALVVQNDREDLRPGPDGWWISSRLARSGDRYGYVLDGEGPFPDPRSASQPDGVHGLSEYLDHSSFEWTDGSWQPPPLAAAVIYELHVGTFTPEGTFDAAIQRLSHLVELGITHVEVMPVNEFSGVRGWGYDGVQLFAPHHAYGGPEGFKRFINACHTRGLAVILDVVYNHLGPAGNYLSRYGWYFTDRYKTPWGEAVNFDEAGSVEPRRFFLDNALMWLRDYHLDGLRLDAVHAFVDMSAVHFLEQLAAEVDVLEATTGRHMVLIAESDLNDPRIIRAREAHGYGIDAQWSDDFHHALHSVLTGEQNGYYQDFGSLAHLATALEEGFVYAGGRSGHRNRVHGRRLLTAPGWRLVVAAQNHDQVGNRAGGERLTHLVSPNLLKVAAGILLTSPFVPLIFQGEEWGATSPFQYFTAHEDETLGRQVSEGRRREFAAFGWDAGAVADPQDVATFERSRLDWQELSRAPHRDLLDWYRALIEQRRITPSLRDGDYTACEVTYDEFAKWLVIRRTAVTVACNLSSEPRELNLQDVEAVRLSSCDVQLTGSRLRLPPESVAILDTRMP